MPLNLTTLGRLALLTLLVCLTSSVPAENSPRQSNNPATALSPGNSAVSNADHRSNADAEASLCLTGLCPSGVWALCEYNGDLYAGGYFTSADGQTAKYIARWDGSQWHDVGGGMNHYVYDLLVYDGKLIAGGVFDTVNGEPMGHVAAWDGVSWTPLGAGINRRPGITDMIIYDSDLIVAGIFDSAGSVATPNMAKWNGTSWEAFGPDGGFGFRAMTVFRGDLILSNAPDGGFSRWDGSTWTTIPVPMNRNIYCLDVYDDQLIAGGFFVTAGEDTVNHIIAWDGTNWSALDGGVGPEYAKGSNVSVQSLYNYQNDLIVGGNFTLAGGDTANFIARWDGVSWHPIGGGMGGDDYEDHWVTALTEYGGDLVAGGFFTTAEGLIVNRIAAWDGDTWRPLTAREGMPFAIEIDNNQAVIPGATVSVPVTKIAGSGGMYGFDMLIAYDSIYANFIGADPGVVFDSGGNYQWEYFTYRADTGFIRIVGLAETNNGPHHPLSGDVPNGTVLFNLNFQGGEVGTWEYAHVNLEYYWQDCGDNAILADSLGYDLAISDSVYNADGINITDHETTFPTNAGAPDDCIGGGLTPVTRLVDFYGGKFTVYDDTPIDSRGDINLNGIPYEIADEVMFSYFFLYGFSVFPYDVEASTAASDVNADGIPLRLEDLMYIQLVICGDTIPYPGKVGMTALLDTAVFIQDVSAKTVSVESPHTLGGVFMRFEGEIIPDFSLDVDTSSYIRYSIYDGEYTRVLIFPSLPQGCSDSGFSPGSLFSYTGYGRLVERYDPTDPGWDSPQAADFEGRVFVNQVQMAGGFDGRAAVDPDIIPSSWGRTSPDNTAVVYLYDFAGHQPSDVDPASVRINDSIVPLAVDVFATHPDYPGGVMAVTVPAREFLHGYGPVTDTSHLSFQASGMFADAQPFISLGTFTVYPQSATIHVPAHWATVGEAVESALTGDTVLVDDGIYSGDGNRNITVYGKNFVLMSQNGPEATIIDCGGSESEYHYFLFLSDSLSENSGRLEGFTVRNAYGENRGALYLNNAELAVSHCRFENNYSTGNGGAIDIQGGSAHLEFCLFDDNHAVIGGAIACDAGIVDAVNCTFVANSAESSGGALYAESAAPSMTNCILAFGTGGGAVSLGSGAKSAVLACTDIFGNVGGDWTGDIAGQLGVNGNISSDPMMCDTANGDYRLDGVSPCAEMNNTCLTLLGAFGTGCGYMCGDVSGDMRVNISDVVYLINFIFREGPAPENDQVADLNHDGGLDVADATVLVHFIFRSGPALDCRTN